MSPDHDQRSALAIRLLGPRGELGCDECFEELDRYVELELAGATADEAVPGMRAHLDACPACNEEHVSLRALVELNRSPAPPAAR
jgi:anti-sigma factor RsiW